MIKVSVIIPVYNVEKFLRDCIESVINQTLSDIEIICINDGSPDNSIDILNEYASIDPRITVISQENRGVSVARNRGMRLAKGKYLYFIDSDDKLLDPDALEVLYTKAEEKNTDILIATSVYYSQLTGKYERRPVHTQVDKLAEEFGDRVFNYHDLDKYLFYIPVTIWDKLYRRSFLIDNNIFFIEGLIFEDNPFLFETMLKAQRVCVLNRPIYQYNIEIPKTLSNADDLRLLDMIQINDMLIDMFKEHGAYRKYEKELIQRKISMAYKRILSIQDEYKEIIFQKVHESFFKLFNDEKSYNNIRQIIDYSHAKMFEQVIISDNYREFKLIHDAQENENVNRKERKYMLNTIINEEVGNLKNLPKSLQQYHYNKIRNFIKVQLEDAYNFRRFKNILSNKNKMTVKKIIICASYDEYLQLEEIQKNNNKNKTETEELKKQEDNIIKFYMNLEENISTLLYDREKFNTYIQGSHYTKEETFERILLPSRYNELKLIANINEIINEIRYEVLNKMIDEEIEKLEDMNSDESNNYYIQMRNFIKTQTKDKEKFNRYIKLLNNKNKKIVKKFTLCYNYSEYKKIDSIKKSEKQRQYLEFLCDNKNEITQQFFNTLKANLQEILEDKDEFEKLIESLDYTTHKIIEQILIASNATEFYKIRKTYNMKMKSENN